MLRSDRPPVPNSQGPPKRRQPDPASARSRGFDMRRAVESERRRAKLISQRDRDFQVLEIEQRRAVRSDQHLYHLTELVAEFLSPNAPVVDDDYTQ